MVWRLIAVVWVFALLAGAAFYFSDALFALTQQVLTLDEAGRERVTWLVETTAKVLGILGGILTAGQVIWTFVEGKTDNAAQSSSTDNSTNTTTFHGNVDVRGDFVGRDKVIHGGKDAG